MSGGLFTLLLLTQSRTGLLVAACEGAAWWWVSRRRTARAARAPCRCRGLLIALTGVALWWMAPRLALDGSILNRPKIWLAGLRLFAANPGGVGLGNSGAVASAFLLDGIPEVRTLVSAHVTLLAEFGWIAGWAWFAFIGLALCGSRTSPRAGLAFAGLILSGCSSTVFDWPVLFDFAERGGLGLLNWFLSWSLLALFVGLGVWLIADVARWPRCVRTVVAAVVLAGVVLLGLRLVPAGAAPLVRDGYAVCGEAPRTLVLYDGAWSLKAAARRVEGGAVLPVRGVVRFPQGLDVRGICRMALLGDCREWRHLVKGMPVVCEEEME